MLVVMREWKRIPFGQDAPVIKNPIPYYQYLSKDDQAFFGC